MIFLLLSIIISTLLGISFKVISLKNIDALQAIVVNYIVAGALGFLTTKSSITPANVTGQPFIYLAIFLGLIFIITLFSIARATVKYGISVAQVANRMSVVIPITIAILFYGDNLSVLKITGIILALTAVYLVSHKESSGKTSDKLWWLLPLIIFICSGIIDSSVNYAQRYLIDDSNFDAFLSTIFSAAFFFGMIILIYRLKIKNEKIQWQAIPSGIIIGSLNYASMYTIVKALNSGALEPSSLFPINNLSILTLSTIISVLIFKEKLSNKNWIGILLSLLAIFILGLLPQLLN